MPTRVVLVDERLVVREGLKALLSAARELVPVADAAGAPEVYAIDEEHHPDVLVLAQDVRGVGPAAIARELLRRRAAARVLMLARRSDAAAVREALAAGARGYALESQPVSEVLDAVHAVASGQAYLAPAVAHLVIDEQLRARRGEAHASDPLRPLSPREREVFDLLLRDHTNEQIARLLCISVKTVETHRNHILRKLDVHSIAQLIRFAARNQLLAG
jgi:two-component system, NarL family, response regulator NreC